MRTDQLSPHAAQTAATEVVAMLTAQPHITAASGTVPDAPYPAFCVSRTTSAYVPFWRVSIASFKQFNVVDLCASIPRWTGESWSSTWTTP